MYPRLQRRFKTNDMKHRHLVSQILPYTLHAMYPHLQRHFKTNNMKRRHLVSQILESRKISNLKDDYTST